MAFQRVLARLDLRQCTQTISLNSWKLNWVQILQSICSTYGQIAFSLGKTRDIIVKAVNFIGYAGAENFRFALSSTYIWRTLDLLCSNLTILMHFLKTFLILYGKQEAHCPFPAHCKWVKACKNVLYVFWKFFHERIKTNLLPKLYDCASKLWKVGV